MMLNSNFIRPQYDSKCFSNIPQTVKYLLTGDGSPSLPADVFGDLPQKYKTVILFFIDAFGWRFFEKYCAEYPFLMQIVQAGAVSKLTSQFPSTTAAHSACIHSGLSVGQSGLYEWQYYEPQLDALITPLLFSFAGTLKRDTLKPTKIKPEKLYPTRTFYQELGQQDISSYVFQNQTIARSTFSTIATAGANMIPYKTLPEALVNMQNLLARQKSASYFLLYYDSVDAIGHKYGPSSPQIEAEIDTLLTILDRLFLQKSSGQLANTLFIMTADHGQVEIDPQTTIYLNRDPHFSGMGRYLKTNRRGEKLVPAGSARDAFLYIKDDLLDEARDFLANRLRGKADVCRTEDLIERGFFGPPPLSSAFLGRVGNLVILPYRNESVWWYEKGKFEQLFYGHHGGLTRQEMEIPLLLYNFGD